MMRPQTTLFYDVDTQRDFMEPEGKLYVLGAERIFLQLATLTQCARQHAIAVAGSVDRHYPTDSELLTNGGEYPEHCMSDTAGQTKVAATTPRQPTWIENRIYPDSELLELLHQSGEIYVEKQQFDVFAGNRNAARVFDVLLQGKEDVVVYGVVTEVCVDHAIVGLKDRPMRIHVVVDAIAALNVARGQATLEKWRQWGIHLTTVGEVVASLGQRGNHGTDLSRGGAS
jgi:nicotinamidase/pyrazinamidase